MKKNADTTTFANLLGDTFTDAASQCAFEREVAKLVGFAELLQALDDRHAPIESLFPDSRVAVPSDQAWFWTESWQQKEREVDAHVASDEVETHESVADFLTHLDAPDHRRAARDIGCWYS